MMVCVPNRLMIFLFQTVFSATEAVKLSPARVAQFVHLRGFGPLTASSARQDHTDQECNCQ